MLAGPSSGWIDTGVFLREYSLSMEPNRLKCEDGSRRLSVLNRLAVLRGGKSGVERSTLYESGDGQEEQKQESRPSNFSASAPV